MSCSNIQHTSRLHAYLVTGIVRLMPTIMPDTWETIRFCTYFRTGIDDKGAWLARGWSGSMAPS